MATKILINNKFTSIPGIYTQIKSGIRNPSLALSYGNICIIDAGMGAGFTSVPGINGNQIEGADSVFEFTTIQDFRAYIRGGIYWKLAENLFMPSGSNPGVSKIYFVKAAVTTPGLVTLALTDRSIKIGSKDEGLIVNGTLNSKNELYKGLAAKIVPSTFNANFYRLQIYVGTYKGMDTTMPYDGVNVEDCVGNLLLSSPEFQSPAELRDWALSNSDFGKLFNIELTSTGDGDINDPITSGEYTTLGASYKLFAGGTETYNETSYDRVLDEIVELDNTFFLAPDYGSDGLSVKNTKLFAHIVNEARFDKFMILGGGDTRAQFKLVSAEMAKSYNSDKVILVHGAYKETSSITKSIIVRNSFYKAASILGRICGLAPQIPLTFKTFNWTSEVHQLTKQEKEFALDKGVLCTVRDPELGYICLQGINTLQRNEYLLNEDASSYSIAVKRIVAQLNKEIVINAKLKFFGTELGFNRGTATAEDVKAWLFGFLTQRIASTYSDNIIVSFRDIEVELVGDCYRINYKFEPNFEVNKMIFTGVIVES